MSGSDQVKVHGQNLIDACRNISLTNMEREIADLRATLKVD